MALLGHAIFLEDILKDFRVPRRMREFEIALKDKSKLPRIRPSWPYEPFKNNVEKIEPSVDPPLIRTVEVRQGNPPHWSKRLEVPFSPRSVLGDAIGRWIPEIAIKPSAHVDFVIRSVKGIIQSTCEKLESQCPLFSRVYIVDFGSMAEGTRIFRPDEFDFLVMLPSLSNSQNTQLLCSKNIVKLSLKTDVSAYLLDNLYIPEENVSSTSGNLFSALQNRFFWNLRRSLSSGWVIIKEDISQKNHAVTFHLEYRGDSFPNSEVSVDVCFGIPLSGEDLNNTIVYNMKDAAFLRHLQLLREVEYTELLMVLTGGYERGNEYSFSASKFSFLSETYAFKSGSHYSTCYMLAKFLCRTFLPKVEKLCTKCTECLVRSYHLKNIMLFLMDYYTAESDWEDCELVKRLLEVFEIIRFCSQYREGVFQDYRALYAAEEFESLGQYSPTDGLIAIGDFNFDDGLRKCCIPDLKEMQKALGESTRELLIDYCDFLRKTEWTAGEVMVRLTDLLYALNMRELKPPMEGKDCCDPSLVKNDARRSFQQDGHTRDSSTHETNRRHKRCCVQQ